MTILHKSTDIFGVISVLNDNTCAPSIDAMRATVTTVTTVTMFIKKLGVPTFRQIKS